MKKILIAAVITGIVGAAVIIYLSSTMVDDTENAEALGY